MRTPKAIIELAREYGYPGAVYCGKFGNTKVFEPKSEDDGTDPAPIGLPDVFIWENKKASAVSGMAALDIYCKIEDGDDTSADGELSSEPIIVTNRPFKCQKCDGKVVRLVYGMPGPEMYEKAERKEVVLGGCLFNIDGNPQWACSECKQRYWKK